MTALPHALVPLFDNGRATDILREILWTRTNNLPSSETVLLDDEGKATQVFRTYLQGTGVIVPNTGVQFADKEGRPTSAFTRLLWEVTR